MPDGLRCRHLTPVRLPRIGGDQTPRPDAGKTPRRRPDLAVGSLRGACCRGQSSAGGSVPSVDSSPASVPARADLSSPGSPLKDAAHAAQQGIPATTRQPAPGSPQCASPSTIQCCTRPVSCTRQSVVSSSSWRLAAVTGAALTEDSDRGDGQATGYVEPGRLLCDRLIFAKGASAALAHVRRWLSYPRPPEGNIRELDQIGGRRPGAVTTVLCLRSFLGRCENGGCHDVT